MYFILKTAGADGKKNMDDKYIKNPDLIVKSGFFDRFLSMNKTVTPQAMNQNTGFFPVLYWLS